MENNIAKYRRYLGITQKEMAKRIGIGRSTFHLKEKGKLDFTQTEILKITKEIRKTFPDITVEELFFNDLVN